MANVLNKDKQIAVIAALAEESPETDVKASIVRDYRDEQRQKH